MGRDAIYIFLSTLAGAAAAEILGLEISSLTSVATSTDPSSSSTASVAATTVTTTTTTTTPTSTTTTTTTTTETTAAAGGSSLPLDISDDKQLVGFADNVFIGKVLEEIGNKSIFNEVETQFKVEVIKNIKGSLFGQVTIDQFGGQKGNTLYLYSGDPMIRIGKIYMLATKYIATKNWHTVIPIYGHIQVSDENNEVELTERFTKAYKQEIKYVVIKNGAK